MFFFPLFWVFPKLVSFIGDVTPGGSIKCPENIKKNSNYKEISRQDVKDLENYRTEPLVEIDTWVSPPQSCGLGRVVPKYRNFTGDVTLVAQSLSCIQIELRLE
jgi:hypothetical protein